MPIVQAKRKREEEEKLVQNCQKAKRCKPNRHEMFDKVGYTEDHHHSLYREIPLIGVNFDKILRREIGSFLNGNGGIIAFGVRTNGTILGNTLKRREEDTFKCAVDRVMVGFHPIVKPTMYKLIIEPVYDKYNPWVGSDLVLIQLKVNKGEKYCMYEDAEHEVFIRSRSSPKGPLTAREIKERVTAEYEQRRRENKKREIQIKEQAAVSAKPIPKNTDIMNKGKEARREQSVVKITKDTTTSTTTKTTSTTATTSITVKVVPKINKTVPKVKEGTKTAVPKTTDSGIVKIRRPLATKN